MSLVLIVAFIALMVAVIPVAHALVIASGIALLWDGNLPLTLVVQQMFAQTQSCPMLALPFFILAGTIIMEGRLGEELLKFSGELLQRVRGGALSTTVVLSAAIQRIEVATPTPNRAAACRREVALAASTTRSRRSWL